ncbi:MAG: YciI family protein [Polyangiaceae bacterium]
MSEFLYVFRGGERANSPEEMQAGMQKWIAWMKELGQKGHFKGGEPLERGGAVVKGREKHVTDGPYAEAKDVVGGYLLVQARDLAEAVALSKGCPILEEDGTVEVRQIMQMPKPS